MSQTLTVTIFFVLTSGCAADSKTGALTQTQAASTEGGGEACMTSCTDERGLDPETCDELCNRPDDASCYDSCVEAGGDQGGCRQRCYAAADCEATCRAFSDGGVACRERCAERASPARDERCAMASTEAYQACLAEGGEALDCRQEAASDAYASCVSMLCQEACDGNQTCIEERCAPSE